MPAVEPGVAVGVTTADPRVAESLAGETVMALFKQFPAVPFTSERTIVLSMKVVPL